MNGHNPADADGMVRRDRQGWRQIWQSVEHYWQSLATREKKLLLVMICCLFAAGYYWGVWQPLHQRIEERRRELQLQTSMTDQIAVAAPAIAEAMQAVKQAAGREKGDLSHTLSARAAAHGVSLTRREVGQDQIQVWTAPLAFNTLLAWLNTLRKDDDIDVVVLAVAATDEPGIVNVQQLVLAAGAAMTQDAEQ